MNMNRGRVGREPKHHSGAVATEIPDIFGDLVACRGRKAIEPMLASFLRQQPAFQTPLGNIVPTYLLRRSRLLAGERLRNRKQQNATGEPFN